MSFVLSEFQILCHLNGNNNAHLVSRIRIESIYGKQVTAKQIEPQSMFRVSVIIAVVLVVSGTTVSIGNAEHEAREPREV